MSSYSQGMSIPLRSLGSTTLKSLPPTVKESSFARRCFFFFPPSLSHCTQCTRLLTFAFGNFIVRGDETDEIFEQLRFLSNLPLLRKINSKSIKREEIRYLIQSKIVNKKRTKRSPPSRKRNPSPSSPSPFSLAEYESHLR